MVATDRTIDRSVSLIAKYDSFPDPFFVIGGRLAVNITDTALKCVAFIGIKKNGRFEPRATGFFVRYIEDQHQFDHLVTAEHVVSGLLSRGHDLWLRVNLKNGQAREFSIGDPSAFRFHPDNDKDATDVAVCPIDWRNAHEETGEVIEVDYISLLLQDKDGFLPGEDFAKSSIVLGAEVAIIGLFKSHYGKNKNVPIVRVGNISAMPGEPIFTDYAGYIQAYLVEARSVAGLSGSPVIVFPDATLLLAKTLVGQPPTQGAALLGLMHGHFDVRNLNEDVVADETEPKQGVHTGIGVVVPLKKIIETIEHPELIAMRKQVVADLRRSHGATPDTIHDDAAAGAPHALEASPTHREDFTSLLNAAARKAATRRSNIVV